jgi:hypothetical protein
MWESIPTIEECLQEAEAKYAGKYAARKASGGDTLMKFHGSKSLVTLMVLYTRGVCAMNGLTDGCSVLDTNWAVDFTDGKLAEFPVGERFYKLLYGACTT